MRIQNLIFPKIGVCASEEMYYRCEENHENDLLFLDEKQEITFAKYGKCSFDTYFNGFAIEKWKKYTTIGAVSLCLQLKGRFEVTLNRSQLGEDRVNVNPLARVCVNSENIETFTFPYNMYDYTGILSFSLKALEEGSVYAGGWYDAEVEEGRLQDVKIAINICTFRRERFIMRNLDILKTSILENPCSPLFGNLRVYISDNGQTLPQDELNSSSIRIVPNKNVGGAGGFSRGLMEIMAHSGEFPATHALMMDDDIVIEPESLFRTYTMLRCRKEKYQDMFIGGAMLRLDRPNIQVESGAYWNAGWLHSNKANLDMCKRYNCVLNEVEEYTEYNAWWYCCTPMSVVSEDNLPLPIFIRGDDVEYGLRNMHTLVLLNGICVWHEAFENKYSSYLSYYILRNMLYDNALHEKQYSLTDLLKRLYGSVARELVYYRYKNIDLLIRGVDDFLKGAAFLQTTDGEALHKEILAAGYKAQPVAELGQVYIVELYGESKEQTEGRLHRLLRFATGNGYLLPAKRVKSKVIKIVPMAQCRPVNFYRQKRVLHYDPSSGKGFVTEKSLKQAFRAVFQLIGITFRAIVKYNPAREQFRQEAAQLINAEFWNSYLDMN